MARLLQPTVRAMWRRGLTGILAIGALAGAPSARAPVAVLTQGAVPQYAQVVEGVRAVVPAAPVVDAADVAAVEKLLAQPPEVLVAVGARAFELARSRATRSAVVGAAVLNPDAGGRRDVTAVTIEARPSDALDALAALAPAARRIVALHPPDAGSLDAVRAAASRRPGLHVELKAVDDIAAFKWLFLAALQDHDAIWLLPDARLAKPDLVRFMAQACLERHVALVGFLDGMSRAGALVSVAADLDAIGREAGKVAVEVEGRPREERRDLAFRHAPGKLYVNDRTRAALGLTGALPPKAEVIR